MTEKDVSTSQGVPFRDFQVALEDYFADLNAACNNAQRRFQEIQLEYARNLQNNLQTQATKDVMTAQRDLQSTQDKFMRDFQSASTDPGAFQRFSEAYQKYKKSIQGALTNVDLEAVDPNTLAILGQHLLMVAQAASQLNCLPSTGAASNPFSSTGGTTPANPFK